jgi:hypothetical protein
MKLVDETRKNGKRTVLLYSETKMDRHVVNEFARVLREHPVLHGLLIQELQDDFPSLRLEELE